MRNILVISDQSDISTRFTSLLARFLPAVSVQYLTSPNVLAPHGQNPPPDLIIYASSLQAEERYILFLRVRTLFPKAKMLLYVDFTGDRRHLFEYMAAGANGLLCRKASLFEHKSAIDAIMRGDSFVDCKTRNKLLKMQNVNPIIQ